MASFIAFMDGKATFPIKQSQAFVSQSKKNLQNIAMTFGENLLAARKNKKLSQQQIADRLGVSRVTVGQWEADKTMPEAARIPGLAELLDVTPDALYGFRRSADCAHHLTRKAIIVAELADNLTNAQMDELIRSLEAQKQSNERLLDELLERKKRA